MPFGTLQDVVAVERPARFTAISPSSVVRFTRVLIASPLALRPRPLESRHTIGPVALPAADAVALGEVACVRAAIGGQQAGSSEASLLNQRSLTGCTSTAKAWLMSAPSGSLTWTSLSRP
jgi:hypothetical protein